MVLLYQAGVLHLALAFTVVIVFFGMDLGSRHSVGELIADFMGPGSRCRPDSMPCASASTC